MIAEAIAHTVHDLAVGLALWIGFALTLGAVWAVLSELAIRRLRRRCQRHVADELRATESLPDPLRVIGGHRGPAPREQVRP